MLLFNALLFIVFHLNHLASCLEYSTSVKTDFSVPQSLRITAESPPFKTSSVTMILKLGSRSHCTVAERQINGNVKPSTPNSDNILLPREKLSVDFPDPRCKGKFNFWIIPSNTYKVDGFDYTPCYDNDAPFYMRSVDCPIAFKELVIHQSSKLPSCNSLTKKEVCNHLPEKRPTKKPITPTSTKEPISPTPTKEPTTAPTNVSHHVKISQTIEIHEKKRSSKSNENETTSVKLLIVIFGGVSIVVLIVFIAVLFFTVRKLQTLHPPAHLLQIRRRSAVNIL